MVTQKPEDILNAYAATHNGKALDREKMLKPNEMVGKVLVARLLKMTAAQRSALATIITPQTAGALKIFLPEFRDVLEKVQNAG